MFTPLVWLRRFWVTRAMRGYPVYNPPYKREERLLSKDEAIENFNHFMEHKDRRAAYFKAWLRKFFWVKVTNDLLGFKRLNFWAIHYAGLLYPMGGQIDPLIDYNTPWEGEFLGCNILYDLGITVGELTIENCTGLRWAFDPTSEILPKTAEVFRRDRGSGFQQPKLVGGPNPAWIYSPIKYARQFANRMMMIQTHPKSRAKFLRQPRLMKNITLLQLTNQLKTAMKYSRSSRNDDPLLGAMTEEDYALFIDNDNAQGGDQ